jgi:hypothetical protein
MKKLLYIILFLPITVLAQNQQVKIWERIELTFTSSKTYSNPVQDVRDFQVIFQSPSGREKRINGFWDGETTWKARFMPDETGEWSYLTKCSDDKNSGLQSQKGSFACIANTGASSFLKHGAIKHQPGTFFLAHADGTPFFYTACTAWNGALKANDDEWTKYLKQRAVNNYTAIQLVTTQWRAAETNSSNQVAFDGCGKINIHPGFFRLMDKRIDEVNAHGLLAVPVVLWALQKGMGRELSPGYYLPDDQAILLARYIVARYGANHVMWMLGGDGIYTDSFEQRWKTIGRSVFDGTHQGVVGQHPCGRSWIGEINKDETWLEVIGYQSSHSKDSSTVTWITSGPMSKQWKNLPPKPYINLEPNYEQIRFVITDKDVRNASYWSLFATPLSGITYGANGIWPWLRPGEKILNHGDAPGTSTWYESIEFPGSKQVGYLSKFIQQFRWWELYPAQEILVTQPGLTRFNQFVSVVKSLDHKTILAYVPVKSTLKFRKSLPGNYKARWFNPVTNQTADGISEDSGNFVTVISPGDSDFVLVLEYIETPIAKNKSKK